MTYFDFLIIGSGASGTAAALALRGLNVAVLDVGLQPPPTASSVTSFATPLQERIDRYIGPRAEGVQNLNEDPVSLKLKSPWLRFVTQKPAEHSILGADSFFSSYARGGLANAWGAGVYCFSDRDLKNFPIARSELEPFYRELAEEVGISGSHDELDHEFGSGLSLQEPLPLSLTSGRLLANYQRRKSKLAQRGLTIGRARLAVLSSEHKGRKPYAFDGTDFFVPNNSAIYNPTFTLNRLIENGEVTYFDQMYVNTFRETDRRVEVVAKDLRTGLERSFAAGKLLLAAGNINSAHLVLKSRGDTRTRLPILDNPVSFLPSFHPLLIGKPPIKRSYLGAELNFVIQDSEMAEQVQGSIYGLQAPLQADLLLQLPLSMRANVTALRLLVPAMSVAQLFYPDFPSPDHFLQLTETGALRIHYPDKKIAGIEARMIQILRSLGFLSAPALVKKSSPGSSIHYAGSLPMTTGEPSAYQTDRLGRIGAYKRVHVIDSAVFPWLPAKNLTFTIMANAMRIARTLREQPRPSLS